MTTTNPDTDLIAFLVGKQTALGMNEVAWCKFIDEPPMDLSTWLRYKERMRNPPLRLMQLACRAFPTEQAAIFEAAKRSSVRLGPSRRARAAAS